MSFEEVAKSIIKRSIKSAVCIDDCFSGPYMKQETIDIISEKLKSKGEEFNTEIPPRLYKSFREDGECDLDIYCFHSLEESWRPNYMLNNKDLVVLDWELDGPGGHKSTLKILKDIIDQNNIPFVIIYTHKPREDFGSIAREILSNFNLHAKTEVNGRQSTFYHHFQQHVQKLHDDKSIELDDIELFWSQDKIAAILYDTILQPSKISISLSSLIKEISIFFSIEEKSIEKKLKSALKEAFSTEFPSNLGSLAFLHLLPEGDRSYNTRRIEVDEIGFRINDCIITIFSKPGKDAGVEPDNVFKHFSDLVSNSPHNFITLLSLEMRDKLRSDAYKLDNRISELDEKAFFYHSNWYKKRNPKNYKQEFFDFLLHTWTSELEAYNLNNTPDIFKVLDEYVSTRGLDNIPREEVENNIGDLIVKLSTIKVDDRLEKDPKIRFGDIYKAQMPDGEIEYFLSITPLCVCVDICEVDNNMTFIKSKDSDTNLTSALKKIETDNYSIISDQGSLISINWGECKPFTLYIKENHLERLNTYYSCQPIRLEYCTTLKDNFAQRLSNNSFGTGMSIGIDLPHIY